jgi:phage terminase large subunit
MDQNEIAQAITRAEFPVKLQCLFEKSRYKCIFGGRGSAKSWSVARTLLILGAKQVHRILCAREFQNSISQSVHKLLSDQIVDLGLLGFYEITQNQIRGANGTEFNFIGLKNNPHNVKSFEGVTICWCEESQTLSNRSLDVLIPTIRTPGSEIWFTMNPELETDAVYQRFILNPPENCITKKVNWSDNPWFPEVLDNERQLLKTRDIEAYHTVWEGVCRQTVDGAVFAREMQMAELEERITKVRYDPTKPVYTVWDLGWADSTAIWCVQFIAQEIRFIRYIEDSQQTVSHYLALLQTFGYVYDTHWLPHDAENKTLGSNGRSIQEIVRNAGFKTKIIPKMNIADSINAARTMFRNCFFDRDNCYDGLQCLRHYKYDVDPDTKQFSKNPLHDQYSHGADAFRYVALGVQETRVKRNPRPDISRYGGQPLGWMA